MASSAVRRTSADLPYSDHEDDLDNMELRIINSQAPLSSEQQLWTRESLTERADDNVSLLSRRKNSSSLKHITELSTTAYQTNGATNKYDPATTTLIVRLGSMLQAVQKSFRIMLIALQDHSPLTTSGREHLRKFVLRSGPAYQLPSEETPQDKPKTSFSGWRMGALLNFILLATCLTLELIMLIVAEVQDRRQSNSGSDGVLYSGDCRTINRLTVSIALIVNIIATAMIASSNYMMQCLIAPTASELQKAHANLRYLRIGVSSPMNLEHISWRKALMWCLMALTSVPVHLLFNSAFYGALQANNYAIALFSSDFQNSALWTECPSSPDENGWANLTCKIYNEIQLYENISVSDCINRYSAPLIDRYSNVVLVSSLNSNQRNGTLQYLWSQEVAINQSTFDFNSNYSNYDIPSLPEELPQTLADDLEALFGIFTAFEYGSWVNDYHEHLQWNLSVLALASSVTNVTTDQGSSITPTDFARGISNGTFQGYNSTLTQEPNVYTIRTSDGVKLQGVIGTQSNFYGNAPTRPVADFDPTTWLCRDNITSVCTRQLALEHVNDWRITPYGIPVSYCLSQPSVEGKCELKYSSVILGVVIACDAIKILVIYFALQLADRPLVTFGDALAYFLQQREPLTIKKCLLTQRNARSMRDQLFEKEWALAQRGPHAQLLSATTMDEIRRTARRELFYDAPPEQWKTRKLRGYDAVSNSARITLCCLILSAIATTTALFSLGYSDVRSSEAGDIWNRGLLSPDRNAVYTSTLRDGAVTSASFIAQVVLVNLPQLFFSMLYFAYNSVFTMMHSAEEWSHFARERKSLRVSDPRPGQRSTYWLNLPWSYSLPFVAVSSLLHWMVSRSLYLVDVNVFGPYGDYIESQTIFACGFSTVFLLLVLGILTSVVVVITYFAIRLLKDDTPLVGSNSFVISAMCHSPNPGEHEVCKGLLWGVTNPCDPDPHCALSSDEVDKPIPGFYYR